MIAASIWRPTHAHRRTLLGRSTRPHHAELVRAYECNVRRYGYSFAAFNEITRATDLGELAKQVGLPTRSCALRYGVVLTIYLNESSEGCGERAAGALGPVGCDATAARPEPRAAAAASPRVSRRLSMTG